MMKSVEQVANELLQDACNVKASDIHIVPRSDDAVVRMRIDRDMVTRCIMQKEMCERLISHFKFLAAMDIAERRKPQNGSLEVKTPQRMDLRLSTLPTVHNESLVIRIHLQTAVQPLSQLSLFPSSAKKLLSFLYHSHGLLIFTGPTGSGKTTTMYALLEAAKKKMNRSIVTLEDPVEKRNDGLLQIQINERAGITYEAGLKAALRHDPDIILVGEIRDEETAKVAVRASLTGHLVLTTLHTKDARGAVLRLLDFRISLQEIEQSLLAVAAQRLVDMKCPFCAGKCSPLCKKMRTLRRLSVYELLYGHDLQQVIREAKGEPSIVHRYITLQRAMSKGYALGYIGEEDVQAP